MWQATRHNNLGVGGFIFCFFFLLSFFIIIINFIFVFSPRVS